MAPQVSRGALAESSPAATECALLVLASAAFEEGQLGARGQALREDADLVDAARAVAADTPKAFWNRQCNSHDASKLAAFWVGSRQGNSTSPIICRAVGY